MKYTTRKTLLNLLFGIRHFSILDIRYSIFLLAILLLLFPCELLAIGISAAPATLSLRATADKEAVARFTVSNPSRDVGLFEAYPEEFEEFISLTPSRFVLEAGERREVVVRARRREEGIIRTVIAVETEPLGEPSQGIGGGVRLPFLLEVSPKGNQLAAISARGFALLPLAIGSLLIFALLLLWRREIFLAVRKAAGFLF